MGFFKRLSFFATIATTDYRGVLQRDVKHAPAARALCDKKKAVLLSKLCFTGYLLCFAEHLISPEQGFGFFQSLCLVIAYAAFLPVIYEGKGVPFLFVYLLVPLIVFRDVSSSISVMLGLSLLPWTVTILGIAAYLDAVDRRISSNSTATSHLNG